MPEIKKSSSNESPDEFLEREYLFYATNRRNLPGHYL